VGRSRGFTLIEVLVTATLVGVAIAGALTALGQLARADSYAQNAELLQRLAAQKLTALQVEGDIRTAETEGDFSTEGYPDAEWSLELQTTTDENVEEATITATKGESQQVLSELIFFRPTTTTTTTTAGTGG
jgi:prepilin-type N-terminal cleavage/methylation domain-containing protein